MGQKRLDEAVLVAETRVKLEEATEPRSQLDTEMRRTACESPANAPKPLTQLGSLLEQLKRMRIR
jgi:hypothetical protein